jgi:endo-1,4-beta-xylanase
MSGSMIWFRWTSTGGVEGGELRVMRRDTYLLVTLLVFLSMSAKADDPLAGADARIEKYRKADVAITVIDRDGRPVPGAKVSVEQTRHAFLFGCNIFRLHKYEGKQRETYGREFAALLNYATLPFYWNGYEPTPGDKQKEDRMSMAVWCRDHGIEVKGHPLVWHNGWPKWGPMDPDETRQAEKARVTEIVSQFKGTVDRWDVVNEALNPPREGPNGVGAWTDRDGPAKMVTEALQWARAANANAFLLYNDFKIGPEHEKLIADLVAAKAPFDGIGIQSHMHAGEWPLERVWDVCQTYARFGKAIHFTETTVLSGKHGKKLKLPWPTTPEGEARQADYVEKFYTLLFSHPSVQAITWWDFMDGGWQGAPAGLVRADLTPKPAYDRLLKLIKGKWWTKTSLTTDLTGRASTRAFLGDYRVTVTIPSGTNVQTLHLKPGENQWTVRL